MFGGRKTRKNNKKTKLGLVVKGVTGIPTRASRLVMGRKLAARVDRPFKNLGHGLAKDMSITFGGRKLKGHNSKTRKGHKDFRTHKGSKHFNRHGHYQNKSASYKRGRPARPYARYY